MVVAQKLKEAEITEQDSLLLTRNLLRIAIFNISYIRGLFPEKYFNDKSVPALDMKIKKLMPIDDESRRLIDWMEKGVYDALQKKYLKTLLFCICENIEGPMIEEYSFSFSYSNSEDEEVSMNVSRSGNKKQAMTFKSTSTEITPDQMRSSACKMVRTLVQLMQTLDQMPEERTILMKLFYYDDVTPEDYEPPFFRSCSEKEINNSWTKTPLKMEVGNVNSKHVLLALKVKSVLDPCEDDEVESMGACSGQEDELSSDGEDQYIIAPKAGEKRPCEDTPDVEEDDTQDADHEEQSTVRIREWILSRHVDTADLTEILSNFPDISLALIEEIMDKLVREELLSKSGKDGYAINKGKRDALAVKEETDLPDVPPSERKAEEDHMYMKALYHALPMEYVSIPKLQRKLDGEANQSTVKKLIDRMAEDGFLQTTTANKRLGRRVVRSESTNRKLLEVRKAMERRTGVIENGGRHPFDFNTADFPPNGSTCAALHSMGSELTRTRGRSDTHQNGSTRAGPQDPGNTPVSKLEPIPTMESGTSGRDFGRPSRSFSSQDKRTRSASRVKEPILQNVKRPRTQAEADPTK